MKPDDELKMVEIFSSTYWEIGMVKSLLENAEIEAFIKDEIMGTYFPWYTAPGGAGSVKVFVTEKDVERAKQVIEDFQKNQG